MANAIKKPEEFEVGDIIRQNPNTPYSGSPMVAIEATDDGRTNVTFKNGEIVQFFNGITHAMKE